MSHQKSHCGFLVVGIESSIKFTSVPRVFKSKLGAHWSLVFPLYANKPPLFPVQSVREFQLSVTQSPHLQPCHLLGWVLLGEEAAGRQPCSQINSLYMHECTSASDGKQQKSRTLRIVCCFVVRPAHYIKIIATPPHFLFKHLLQLL